MEFADITYFFQRIVNVSMSQSLKVSKKIGFEVKSLKKRVIYYNILIY